jgi:hypothetical protein
MKPQLLKRIALLTSLFASLTASAKPLPEELRDTYENVRSMTADIAQEKSGKYLARPLKSSCQLTWREGTIIWKTLKPIASEVEISAGIITITDADGKRKSINGSGAAPEVGALVAFLQSLFAFDFIKLEKDFAFTSSTHSMTGTVKPESKLAFLRSFTIEFDASLIPAKLTLDDKNGHTSMLFANVQLERKAGKQGR